MRYIARSQYVLQEGRFVGDLLYFAGEGSPGSLPGRGSLRPVPPEGYDYDGCDARTLLTRVSVKDGRLVLPDGMSYAVLVLQGSERMTPEVLNKVAELVRDGATVIGPRPERSPSLTGYPQCDDEVRKLADEVWGDCDGTTVTERACGKGRIVWGKPLDEVLAAMGVPPDFAPAEVPHIHRAADGADVYFVSSQSRSATPIECSFRVTGKVPELWHPDTGQMETAPVYRVERGRTIVPIGFDPAGSVFVVFRRPEASTDHVVALRRNGEPALFAAPPSPHTLEVREAVYGVLSVELQDMVEVTQQLRALVKDNTLSVRATNALAGDPALNVVKQMRVEYTLDGKPLTRMVEENELLQLPEAGAKGTLEIQHAYYGIIPEGPILTEKRTVDVTQQVASLVKDGRLTVVAGNALAGDPANLVVKQMQVDYLLDGEPYSKTVGENQTLELPAGNERGVSRSDLPFAELSVVADGKPLLTAWHAGEYEADTAAGKALKATVESVPEPVSIAGPWELRFPPKLGAPESVTLAELISWTKHDDPGVKYFSGTATYVKRIDVPQALLQKGSVLMLDLGTVREIAEVKLNGKDRGVLWKPPFRVDITGAAKPGPNDLEVRVTNLWPNRLIGDEQLPPDADYNPGSAIRAWPEWLLQGTPRPSGRIAFSTWQHWHKDSPLIESGLLGPVALRSGRVVRLASK
jgi:hypothetical protein